MYTDEWIEFNWRNLGWLNLVWSIYLLFIYLSKFIRRFQLVRRCFKNVTPLIHNICCTHALNLQSQENITWKKTRIIIYNAGWFPHEITNFSQQWKSTERENELRRTSASEVITEPECRSRLRKESTILPKPEQDLESDFWMKTELGAGVRISVFTGIGWLILLNLNFLWKANC